MHALAGASVQFRFALPAEPLRRFVTTFYRTEVVCPVKRPWLEDWLHPEWANIRFLGAVPAHSVIGTGTMARCPAFTVTGPTSRAVRFRLGSGHSWGVGLLPLGWARFFDLPASELADQFCSADDHPAFAGLRPIIEDTFDGPADAAAEAARIDSFMLGVLKASPPHSEEARIRSAHAALVDPAINAVSDLAERIGTSSRSLERLSLRAFGFSPKLLLRRQRFLRSLAQFMLDPSLKWIATLDWQYVDQAHFVRDFKRFMGMSPSQYARMPKPLLAAAAQARMAAAGQAVQGLHAPTP